MASRPARSIRAAAAAGGSSVLLLVLGVVLLVAPAHAYPSLFVNEVLTGPADCLTHPTKGFGSHGPPGPDA
jgi:hypothetical protein